MKVLITGVAGLLGSRLADQLIDKKNITIFGVDNLSGGYESNIHKDVKFFNLDLSKDNLDDLFNHKFDYVFHFAAYAAEGLSPFIRSFNYTNNLISTTRVVNQCIRTKVKRLVFTSSMAVYGIGNPPFDEDDIPSPIDPYGIAKYACEMDIQVAGQQHGLDWCIIRPHNVYGKNQNIWDKYRNVLGIWMYQAINKKPMTIFGDGEQSRAFSYIDDCLDPLWNSAILPKASKQIINLGGSTSRTINEANKILRDITKYDNVEYLQARHEVKKAHPTWKKSVDILGYKDTTNLHDGLYQMWEWAKCQPQRNQFVWSNYELDSGIYSFWK